MEPDTPFLDALDDGLVQHIIARVPPGWSRGWQQLACSSQRLCSLTRRTLPASLRTNSAGVLHLLKAAPHRAFTHVKKLHLEEGYMKDAEDFVRLEDAAAAAVTAWPQLEEVGLSSGMDSVGGCLTAGLLALRAAPALRQLKLEGLDPQSLAYLPVLTQLTHLELCGDEYIRLGGITSCPLALMPNLVSLRLVKTYLRAGGIVFVLPPNLTSLHLEHCWESKVDWRQHIVQCSRLEELCISGDAYDIHSHPISMLQAFAGQLTGLVQLSILREEVEERWGAERLHETLALMHQEAGAPWNQQQVEEWWPPVWPLGAEGPLQDPKAYIVVPPPNMGSLVNLQHLNLQGWALLVDADNYWEALAGCSSLRSLSELHVGWPPHAGITFPHVTGLEVTSNTTPRGTLALLGAFPALEELQLTLAPLGAVADQVPVQGDHVEVHSTSSARIKMHKPQQLEEGRHVHCLAGYCSTLYGALPGLRSLDLEWPTSVPLLGQLPAVSALQQLAWLRLQSRDRDLEADQGWKAQDVEVQEVVRVVQGATQLQDLVLDVCLAAAPGSTKDQLVLGLQEALPGLARLGMEGTMEELASADLTVMMAGLSVRKHE